MNASAGEARAAKLLSNVMDARRKLEEDAGEGLEAAAAAAAAAGGGGRRSAEPSAAVAPATAEDASVSALRGRLEEAMAVAEVRCFRFVFLFFVALSSSKDGCERADPCRTKEKQVSPCWGGQERSVVCGPNGDFLTIRKCLDTVSGSRRRTRQNRYDAPLGMIILEAAGV